MSATHDDVDTPSTVSMATTLEVHAFLAHEALLLDEERYPEWLDLFTEDAHYWVPGVENRNRTDAEGPYAAARMSYFDDTKADLALRVARFGSPTAWAENPPTRHLHIVTNIQVDPGTTPDELVARSVFVNHRSQWSRDETTLYGRREDRLRRVDGALRVARRRVVLAHATLPAKNINTFF